MPPKAENRRCCEVSEYLDSISTFEYTSRKLLGSPLYLTIRYWIVAGYASRPTEYAMKTE